MVFQLGFFLVYIYIMSGLLVNLYSDDINLQNYLIREYKFTKATTQGIVFWVFL